MAIKDMKPKLNEFHSKRTAVAPGVTLITQREFVEIEVISAGGYEIARRTLSATEALSFRNMLSTWGNDKRNRDVKEAARARKQADG